MSLIGAVNWGGGQGECRVQPRQAGGSSAGGAGSSRAFSREKITHFRGVLL